MTAATLPAAVSVHSPIYAKTSAGTREVAERSCRLSALQRRVLILVDGVRSRSELAGLLGAGEIDTVLAELRVAGLISDGSPQPAPQPVVRPVVEVAPAILHDARQLMHRTTRLHLGLMGVALQDKIVAACSRNELLSVCAQWHLEIRESRAGRDEADALLASFHEILRAA